MWYGKFFYNRPIHDWCFLKFINPPDSFRSADFQHRRWFALASRQGRRLRRAGTRCKWWASHSSAGRPCRVLFMTKKFKFQQLFEIFWITGQRNVRRELYLYCKITKYITQRRSKHIERKGFIQSIVADPEPDSQDPYVFWPPGSGSGSISTRYRTDPDPSIEAKIVRKILIPTVLWLLYDFLS